jgi:phage repressor protein C with HTH and peptisase S24 domain/predicted DNA-binding transcriptional regulator AlpA
MTWLNDSLRTLRTRAGLSMAELAALLQMPRASSYQYYEKGFAGATLPPQFQLPLMNLVGRGDPPINELEVMALFGRSALWKPVGGSPEEDYSSVPVYDIRASAGPGSLVEDGEPLHHQVFRRQFLNRLSRAPIEELAVIQVAGDSMWETLHSGDHVLIDRTVKRIVADGIYVLLYDGELLVKRCQRDLQTGDVILKSDNPRYETIRVSESDLLVVCGRAIWLGRSLS